MRARWTLLGGAGIASFAIATLIVARSSNVAGETGGSSESAPPQTPPAESKPAIVGIEPGKPLQLGPDAIPYENLSPGDQAGVDRIIEQEEINQPESSLANMRRAADQAADAAKLEIQTRLIGLVGIDEQGVVP